MPRQSPVRTRHACRPVSFFAAGGRGASARSASTAVTRFWPSRGSVRICRRAAGVIRTEYIKDRALGGVHRARHSRPSRPWLRRRLRCPRVPRRLPSAGSYSTDLSCQQFLMRVRRFEPFTANQIQLNYGMSRIAGSPLQTRDTNPRRGRTQRSAIYLMKGRPRHTGWHSHHTLNLNSTGFRTRRT